MVKRAGSGDSITREIKEINWKKAKSVFQTFFSIMLCISF